MVARFWAVPRETFLNRLSALQWEGSGAKCISDFAAIISEGEALPPEILMEILIAKLPSDIYLRLRGEVASGTLHGKKPQQ